MSGGKEKKARSKAQGWEEAGAEFYQESYPGDVENNVHRDPSKLATLLPSKQTRVGKFLLGVESSATNVIPILLNPFIM